MEGGKGGREMLVKRHKGGNGGEENEGGEENYYEKPGKKTNCKK